MTNHPNRRGKFELTFWGGDGHGVRYRRFHKTEADARAEAERVLNAMSNRGAYPAIVYDVSSGKQLFSVM